MAKLFVPLLIHAALDVLKSNVPIALKSSSQLNCLAKEFSDKFFMKRGDDGNLHLPSDHAYYTQVQGEMAIIGVEWCDFVVYSNGHVIADRIVADLDYWNNLSERLEQFYITHVIPEILSGRIFIDEFGTST